MEHEVHTRYYLLPKAHTATRQILVTSKVGNIYPGSPADIWIGFCMYKWCLFYSTIYYNLHILFPLSSILSLALELALALALAPPLFISTIISKHRLRVSLNKGLHSYHQVHAVIVAYIHGRSFWNKDMFGRLSFSHLLICRTNSFGKRKYVSVRLKYLVQSSTFKNMSLMFSHFTAQRCLLPNLFYISTAALRLGKLYERPIIIHWQKTYWYTFMSWGDKHHFNIIRSFHYECIYIHIYIYIQYLYPMIQCLYDFTLFINVLCTRFWSSSPSTISETVSFIQWKDKLVVDRSYFSFSFTWISMHNIKSTKIYSKLI